VILRRAANGRPVAEDLYQEVFLRAIEKVRAGEVRDPERLSGFICGLARNLAIDHFRRGTTSVVGRDPGVVESGRDQGPGPLEQVLRKEDERFVRQTVEELPAARDRQLLWRFYIREEDKEGICADLKLSSLQFNRVLHRARERFRDLYKKRGIV
jgi:RNA polymerase sigma-70 factor (ECF subfamily)